MACLKAQGRRAPMRSDDGRERVQGGGCGWVRGLLRGRAAPGSAGGTHKVAFSWQPRKQVLAKAWHGHILSLMHSAQKTDQNLYRNQYPKQHFGNYFNNAERWRSKATGTGKKGGRVITDLCRRRTSEQMSMVKKVRGNWQWMLKMYKERNTIQYVIMETY